ncbi:Phosphoribosylanthranilate isomerase [Candidatus Vidania fulgoroideae]|nr:Phosphoribosylanthranilate isomerase [Candidatus Vidania fulgoroideae]
MIKNRTLIKFCGLKRRRDFLKCISLKVDAVGFVFYKKSDRYISIRKAKKIIGDYKSITFPQKIGVFYKPSISLLKKVEKENFIDLYQICGNNLDKRVKGYLKKKKKKYIRSFNIKKENSFNLIRKINKSKKKIFFIDSYSKNKGGSGKTFNWSYINFIKKKIFVSGGINLKNLKEILSYKPFGIDISSGIEKKDGFKDKKLMKKIVKIVNEL